VLNAALFELDGSPFFDASTGDVVAGVSLGDSDICAADDPAVEFLHMLPLTRAGRLAAVSAI
jgi:hypothetical protein